MIQRIQTVYLALAALLLLAFAAFGLSSDPVAAEEQWHAWLTFIARLLSGLAAIGALYAIFGYADRPVQRKTIANTQWVVLLVLIVEVVVLYLFPELLAFAERGWAAVPALLPIGGYAFLMLARRAVDRDIALVKSMDRLR
jgi:hypothetical protein